MGLSKRLLTVALAVTPGHRVADIGTDHGYVPIYLIKHHICPEALAMDVNPGPLDRAREHIRSEGLADRIQVRLGDGLLAMEPDEADSIIIAGMGGDLICRILAASPAHLAARRELILQPQSEWFKVRRFLRENNYCIRQEWFLEEAQKYYVVMKASAASDSPNSDVHPEQQLIFDRYGRYLLEEKNPVLFEYLKKEKRKKEKIAANLERQSGTCHAGYKKLKAEMETIDKLEKIYYYLF